MTTSAPLTTAWSTDPYTLALRAGRGPLFLHRADGHRLRLEVERWCRRPDAADQTVLERCVGTVLDVGCGPGRMVAALARQARPALGIDTAWAAVRHTRDRGGTALLRSVFDALPDEGRWDSVLLMDGNVGIGGDPLALLRRLGQLVTPGGLLLVEAAGIEVDERFDAWLDDDRGGTSPPFPWARVGMRALYEHARAAGWEQVARWTEQARPFLALRPA
ncbi:methyltransferase domain-containing protein [Streptomyces sp. DSM 44915]|uniref:Methyltransferase domain-containing protein n=1 Tax=Streptomyces chisholmiae TaxID=3075540 RepID=A0ABU2JLB0_9ACTN|nr:methyltransferase domain-containing protein [Streptomyces sp. DSM 44915]MDT0265043.1 methyltransferase domain-containing protein [Streptomyces sp. DSM 44915]